MRCSKPSPGIAETGCAANAHRINLATIFFKSLKRETTGAVNERLEPDVARNVNPCPSRQIDVSQKVAEVWNRLPGPVRAGILAMVKATSP